MKSRKLSDFFVVLVFLVGIFTCFPVKAEAATTLGSAPYAKVEYGYSADVTSGTIRYISQLTSSGYFNWSYWPASNSLANYSTPGYECGTASMSMALSYIGVNKTPYDLLVPYNGSTMFISWGDGKHSSIGTSASAISAAMDNYVNGNGKYSPLVIYMNPYSSSGGMHYVVLAGKESSSRYTVIDPANNSTWSMTISGSSAICPSGTFPITQAHQWYNSSSSIAVAPTNVRVVTDKSTYTLGETVTVTPSAQGADHYSMRICYGSYGEETTVFSDFSGFNGSKTYTPTKSGYYIVRVSAIASNGKWTDAETSFKVEGKINYYNASGSVWNSAGVSTGSEYKLRTDYPKTSGKYFCGWTYTKGQTTYDVRPGDTITVGSGEVNLYPVYVTHKKAISGDEVEIYNISDFKDTGYNIKKVEHKKENKVDTSYWTDWSSYGLTPVTASSTVQVRTTTMYRYYYFLCPSCGRHEPFTGKSDCGAQISSGAWHETWSTVPYSQSSYGTFSYTKAKYYTTSLGDGQMWIFSSGNVNATAVGTKDATGSAVIIETGYSTRTYVKQSRTDTTIRVAYKITPKSGIKITAQPQSKKVEAGQTAKLTVSASGENLTYQWQYCHAGGTKWYNSSMTGSKTKTLTIKATAARNGQKYRCIIKNTKGSVTSNTAVLTVTAALQITTQPKNQSAAAGKTAKFTVGASGSGLRYQWQYCSATGTKWYNSSMTGNKTKTLTVTATTARNGQKYRCLITDANGKKLTSKVAVLKITK